MQIPVTEDDRSDAEVIEDALDSVKHIKSSYRAADILQISASSVQRYRKLKRTGEPYPNLHDDTRDALIRGTRGARMWDGAMDGGLAVWEAVAEASPQYGTPSWDPDASAPAQMLSYLISRLGHDEVALVLAHHSMVAAAYVLGTRHRFTQGEWDLIDSWRNQILAGSMPDSGPLERAFPDPGPTSPTSDEDIEDALAASDGSVVEEGEPDSGKKRAEGGRDDPE